MKTEPETFSIDDLERVRIEPWTGVRNYTARNHMRAMKVGDDVLIYHSSVEPPGVVGLARVARTGVVDETQFDPESPYFDPRSKREKPQWDCVEVEFVAKLPHLVSLTRMRRERALRGMVLFTWSRLSVQPVTEKQFQKIVELAQTAEPAAKKRVRR
jgi:predicted RNA-binding protein with PUA-like domain